MGERGTGREEKREQGVGGIGAVGVSANSESVESGSQWESVPLLPLPPPSPLSPLALEGSGGSVPNLAPNVPEGGNAPEGVTAGKGVNVSDGANVCEGTRGGVVKGGGEGGRREVSGARRGVGSFLAGAISGTVMGAALQPFDVIRTHLQAHMGSAAPGSTHKALSMSATTRRIIAANGVRGLWRGVGPTCVRIGLGAGIYFATLDRLLDTLRHVSLPPLPSLGQTKSTKGTPTYHHHHQQQQQQQQQQQEQKQHGEQEDQKRNERPSAVQTFAAGLMARTLAVVLLNPVTVVKTRMELTGPGSVVYKGTWSGIASIAQREGISGLFKGLGPTWARDAPYSAVYLVLYSHLRTLLLDVSTRSKGDSISSKPSATIATAATFTAGAMAGAIATVLTHPPDVIRTTLQLSIASGAHNAPALTFMTAAKSIWRDRGAAGLFSGVMPRVIKRSLQQALGWVVFERASKALMGRTIWEKSHRHTPIGSNKSK